jgi:hypothetical protein
VRPEPPDELETCENEKPCDFDLCARSGRRAAWRVRYRAAAKAEADLGAQPVEIMKADRASSMERAPSYPVRTGKK